MLVWAFDSRSLVEKHFHHEAMPMLPIVDDAFAHDAQISRDQKQGRIFLVSRQFNHLCKDISCYKPGGRALTSREVPPLASLSGRQ